MNRFERFVAKTAVAAALVGGGSYAVNNDTPDFSQSRPVAAGSPSPEPSSDSGPLETVNHTRQDTNIIPLSFDIGQGRYGHGASFSPEDRANIDSVLETLHRHNTTATFFITGQFMEDPANKPLIQKMIDYGDEFANHSYDHQDSKKLTKEQFADEITKTETAIYKATGKTPRPWYRYPFLSTAYPDTVAQLGYKSVWVTCSDGDWKEGTTAQTVFDALTSEKCAKPGTTQGVHAYTPEVAQALDGVLTNFEKRGLRVATLSEAV